jgi:cellulase/cellobiase CelA1
MRRILRACLAAGVLASAALTAFAIAGPANADTQICEQYGATTVGGRYIVMNNRWGTSAQQCINVTSTGFAITSQQGTGSTSGAPVSYPAIYLGCHYTRCSPGTNLPIRVSSISSATSRISYNYVQGATYDAAYDIWLDPAPKTDGVSQQEIMIWFNRQGSIQPIGSVVGNATIGGRTWQVWQGSNGSNAVVSYVAPSAISSWSFSVLDFIRDVQNRGAITSSWYLTSIQAGFEPWIGGAGLAVTDFAAEVNGGGNPPSSPTTPVPPSTSCRVTYATTTWSTGLTANVTVTNTGSTALNGWALGFTLPSGQTITGSWNAALTGSAGAVTARNVAYNSTLAPNASTSFGFQATHSGNTAAPGAFSLNGNACTTA